MARTNELKATVTADVSNFNSAMSLIGGSAASAAAAAVTAIIGISATVAALGKDLVSASKRYEDLESSIRASIGDIKEADKWLKIINETAAKSTENNVELGETFATLFAFSGENLAKQFENVTSRAKILKLSLVETSAQLGSMFERLRTGEPTSILETLRSQQIARFLGEAGSNALRELIKNGATSQQVMSKLLEIIEENGKAASELRKGTATGKENILLGLLDFKKAGEGTRALEKYKQILDELIKILENGDFSEIGEAFDNLLTVILELVQSSGFKEFLEFSVTWIARLANAVAAVTIAFSLWAKQFEPIIKFFNMMNDIWQKLIDKGLDIVIPDSKISAEETKRALEDAKLQREANKRLIHNLEAGPPAQ